MKLKIDYNNMMRSSIGEKGISDDVFEKEKATIERAYKNVTDGKGKGWQQWAETPYISGAELDDILSYGKEVNEKAESFVVFGIGGSALGAIAVGNALLHLRHNELPRKKRNAPKLYVEDNVDPERMAALLDVIDLETSYFNVITKSGETSETLSQFLIIYDLLKKKLGVAEAKNRISVTTTICKGTLYNVAKKEGFKIFGIGAGVGGRFSVLSPVGLLPFAVMGIDVEGLLKGGRTATDSAMQKDIRKNPALMTAFLKYISMKLGYNVNVMMPYADSLKFMSDFYCQLWGESLGKAIDKDGKTVYAGQTPVKSLGVTDQHSQVQLYTEGPFDKVTTFLVVSEYRTEQTIANDRDVSACDFLKGRTMNELITAEFKATRYALAKACRLNYTVEIERVTAETIGELLVYMMYETAFAGALLNVDTFNQPGVEEGKKATFAMLGRSGYEEKLREVNSAFHSEKYTV